MEQQQTHSRRGFSFLSMLLGILLGIIIAVGAVIGVAFYVSKMKVDKLIPSNGDKQIINTDVDAGGVQTVGDLIKRVVNLADGFSERPFSELAVTFPVVNDIIDEVGGNLSEFFSGVTHEEFAAQSISTVADYLTGLKDRVDLAGLMTCRPDSNPIIKYLAFRVTGMSAEAPYTAVFTDGEGVKHEVIPVLDEEGNIVSVHYADDESVQLEELTISNLNERIDGIMEDVPIGDIVGDTSSNRILKAIAPSTIKSLESDLNTLTVQWLFADEVYGMTADGEDALTVPAEVYKAVDADSAAITKAETFEPRALYYVKGEDETYSLANGNGKLTNELFSKGDKEYYTYGFETDEDGNKTYLIGYDPSFAYYTLNDDGGYDAVNSTAETRSDRGRLEKTALQSGDYFTFGAPASLWKIIVMNKPENADPEAARVDTLFELAETGSLVTRVQQNMEASTMSELSDAKIITYTDPSILTKDVKTREGTMKKYGECTLKEIIESFNMIVNNGNIWNMLGG